MDEGGKLVAFIVIGMVLIAAVAFIFFIQQPNLPDNTIDLPDVDDFEPISPLDKDKPTTLPEIDDDDDESSDDEDEKETEEKKSEDKKESSSNEKTEYDNELLKILYDYAIPFALLISYSIVALAFMVSKIFSSREAETWAKLELREVLISTMYAAIILSFLPVFNLIVDDFSLRTNGYNVNSIFIQLMDHSFGPIKSTMDYMFMFSSLNWIGWNPSAVVGIPFMPTMPVVHLNYAHFYDSKAFINLFSLFAHTFIPILFSAMVSIMGQIVVLNFFEKALFVFIGLGIAMRSFTFTRKMGGTLLAIVLGLFFLLKLMLVIEASIYTNMGLNTEIKLEGDASFEFFEFISQAISLLMEGLLQLFEVINFPLYFYQYISDCIASMGKIMAVFCIIIAPIMWLIDLIIAIIKIVVGIIFWAFSVISIMLMGVVTITDNIDFVIINSIALYSDVIVFAFFMPVLNFIIIIAGIKSLTETFGGDAAVVNMLTFI